MRNHRSCRGARNRGQSHGRTAERSSGGLSGTRVSRHQSFEAFDILQQEIAARTAQPCASRYIIYAIIYRGIQIITGNKGGCYKLSE